MIKPDSLRTAIVATIPSLSRDAERLLMFIDRGSVRGFMTTDRSFEYRYKLNIIITDFAGSPSIVMLAILDWARINQPELTVPPNDALTFEADILDNKAVDMSLEIMLTESVKITINENGKDDLEHIAEPALLFNDDTGLFDPTPPLTGHSVED
ncbi:phage tail protein [Parasphingorhabdus sp. JC815]|uniref:phage tail protein n=1 Tax=Parasphingorhabdus sp. JC815 TaxID=3232140 RepID=UPI00345922C8